VYLPSYFAETRLEPIAALIFAHPLAAVVHSGPTGLDANHVPLVFDAEAAAMGRLRGHFARANPVVRELAAGSEVLAIFQGPSHYLSPNWYPSKHAHGKDVPTWNYMIVHARGRIAWHEESTWLLELLNDLTDAQERHRAQPWRVSDAPGDYLDQMMRAIVGFEIGIDVLEGKWKLSQNRTAADRAGAIAGLSTEPGDAAAAIANAMREVKGRD
jgi:transcriptional regulator